MFHSGPIMCKQEGGACRGCIEVFYCTSDPELKSMSTVNTRPSRRLLNVRLFKMGLFLYVAGPIKPTEATNSENVVQCEGLHNQSYVCEVGHCCGNSQCCSYYYELWWFWLVWAIIFILSCCCMCHHRRTKRRLQQQQRQHEINLIAYREAHNYTTLPFYMRLIPSYLLPDYEEVVARPPSPPPPYSPLQPGSAVPIGHNIPGDQPTSLLLPPAHQVLPLEAPTPDSLPPGQVSDEIEPPPGYDRKASDEELGGLEKHASRRSVMSDDDGSGSRGDVVESEVEVQKEPLLRELLSPQAEEKERGVAGRHRRFTGDSGIDICVCGRGILGGGGDGGHTGLLGTLDAKAELEELLTADKHEDCDTTSVGHGGCIQGIANVCSDDFCEACCHRTAIHPDGQVISVVERRGADSIGQQSSSSLEMHPSVCLFLHTINEQETAQCPSSTES